MTGSDNRTSGRTSSPSDDLAMASRRHRGKLTVACSQSPPRSPSPNHPRDVAGNPDASRCFVGRDNDPPAPHGSPDRGGWPGSAARPRAERRAAPSVHNLVRSKSGRLAKPPGSYLAPIRLRRPQSSARTSLWICGQHKSVAHKPTGPTAATDNLNNLEISSVRTTRGSPSAAVLRAAMTSYTNYARVLTAVHTFSPPAQRAGAMLCVSMRNPAFAIPKKPPARSVKVRTRSTRPADRLASLHGQQNAPSRPASKVAAPGRSRSRTR